MFVIPEGPIAYFDVDDTLIEWRNGDREHGIKIKYNGFTFIRNPIMENINELILQAESGTRIVVWSKGGVAWAECIVKVLGLVEYVDCILPKPGHVYDDKPPSKWMPTESRFGSSSTK